MARFSVPGTVQQLNGLGVVGNIARSSVLDDPTVIGAGDEPGDKVDQHLRSSVSILNDQSNELMAATPSTGTDFSREKDGEGGVRERMATARAANGFSSAWRQGLLLNEEGAARPVLANAIHALRNAPDWRGVLQHDAFSTVTVARQAPPWARNPREWTGVPWTDRDDCLAADWLQRHEIIVPPSIAGQAVETVARDRTFHPVRDYLDALDWDGARRLETWLVRYLGALDTPFQRAVGPRWLISGVARIYKPGSKADCAIILEGPQGIRKSTALRVLADLWFTDRLSDLGSKDAAMETRGVWILEIAELDTMSRSKVGTTKAFMSRTHDRFRPPYGKRLVNLARQCIFAGSINPEGGYLKDATGGRRFWPVVCGTIDIEALQHDRDQLWAEARDRFHKGEPWWLETRALDALATEQQAARYQGDPWEEPIRAYLDRGIEWIDDSQRERNIGSHRARTGPLGDVSIAEVLEKALGLEKARWTQADQNRVVRSLVAMGFYQYRARYGDNRERRYRRDKIAEAGS